MILSFILYGILGFVLGVGGINIIDNTLYFLLIMAIVIGIEINSTYRK